MALRHWNRGYIGHIKTQLKDLHDQIPELQNAEPIEENLHKESELLS